MARVYAIASAKGGVGKTTTTANLGATLAGTGADVVVIDGDIGMANLGAALGVRPHGATLHDALSGSVEPEAAAYEGPAGLVVVPGDTSLEAFSAADPQQLQSVVDAFDDADYVLIDVGAGVSHETSVPLSVADAVVLVSTAERDALVDTEKTRQLTERLGGVVAGAVLTRTDEAAPIEEIISGTLTAEILTTIPEDEAVRESIAVGEPLLSYAPHSDAAAAYRRLAAKLTGTEPTAPEPAPVDSEPPADSDPDAAVASEAPSESLADSRSDADGEPDAGSEPTVDVDTDPDADSADSDSPAETVADAADDQRPESDSDSGVTIDPTESESAASDDKHNVVNPFAATPEDETPTEIPEGAESKWAEAATGTGSDSDGIEIDPGAASRTDATEDDGISIQPPVADDPTEDDDDGIEIQPEETDDVPQDAIPFGADESADEESADEESAQTTVLGAAIESESDGADENTGQPADEQRENESADEQAADDEPLIPDAEETAAATADKSAAETVDESESDTDDEEKRGFFSRLFR